MRAGGPWAYDNEPVLLDTSLQALLGLPPGTVLEGDGVGQDYAARARPGPRVGLLVD